MRLADGRSSGWAPLPGRTGYVLAFALGVLWVFAVAWAAMSGPRLLAAMEQQEAAEMKLENQGACQRLGMPEGSTGYAACMTELKGVQRQQQDRLNRRSASLI